MLTRQSVLSLAKKLDKLTTRYLVRRFGVSRQYASMVVRELVKHGELVKVGSTRKAYYVVPGRATGDGDERLGLKLSNKNLEEHEIFKSLQRNIPGLSRLDTNSLQILNYTFSEMMNNAIEHSQAKTVTVECSLEKGYVQFSIRDTGIGIFKNVMASRSLNSETEAMQDILKGKTTTRPERHTGEGIFFTSKESDLLVIGSFGYVLRIDNIKNDVFFGRSNRSIRGTEVSVRINRPTKKGLTDIFRKYTDDSAAFSRTEIIVRLYEVEGSFVSRSEARRLLEGLQKFSSVILDFNRVAMVGQAFVDEVFRVFQSTHPGIVIKAINVNDAVRFMIERRGDKVEK